MAEGADGQDIFYVCKKALQTIQEQLKAGKEITKDAVSELTFPDNLGEDEIMTPVDMRGIGEEFEDVEQMLEKLGPKGTAEAFVKAKEFFDKNTDKEPEGERPTEMTLKEWREVLDEEHFEGEEEEMFFEGEEEEFGEEAEEEDGGEVEEPAAKKAKTA